jgi:DNA-binding Lrp family transcriptional regulator
LQKSIQKVKFYLGNHDGLEKLALLAYVLITVKSGSEREFVKQISKFDEVVEANLVIGENDIVIKIKVKNISQIDQFLTDKLRVLPDVFLTTTMIITEKVKPKKT